MWDFPLLHVVLTSPVNKLPAVAKNGLINSCVIENLKIRKIEKIENLWLKTSEILSSQKYTSTDLLQSSSSLVVGEQESQKKAIEFQHSSYTRKSWTIMHEYLSKFNKNWNQVNGCKYKSRRNCFINLLKNRKSKYFKKVNVQIATYNTLELWLKLKKIEINKRKLQKLWNNFFINMSNFIINITKN